MKSSLTLLLPTLLVGLYACGREDAPPVDAQPAASQQPAQLEGETGCLGDCEEGAAEAVAKTEALKPTGVDGKGVTLTELTKISAILATPDDYLGKRVLVRGEAVGVCEKRGCWVELKSDHPYQSIRVKVEDGEIVFPMSCLGSEVTCEGIVQKLEFPVEKHREILKARADAKGETFDPASVTTPLVVWQIKGLGARIEG